VQFGSPNGETGMTIQGANGRADLRFDGAVVSLVAAPVGGVPPPTNGLQVTINGAVLLGKNAAVRGDCAGLTSPCLSVDTTGTAAGFVGQGRNVALADPNVAASFTGGTTWFSGDSRVLPASFGKGVEVGFTTGGGYGYISAVDYNLNAPQPLHINSSGGFVNIGPTGGLPVRQLDVGGRARIHSIPLEASAAAVCFNSIGDLLQCGESSLKWKTNVQSFLGGLDIVRRLRPINFNWKESGLPDIGLGAEDVAKVAPSLTFVNSKGEAEGVKYDRINVVLINAIKEQQQQIERQQKQIATLVTSNAALNARLRGVEKSLRKKAGSTRPRRRIAVQGR